MGKRKSTGKLLLCVFAYLYQIADIPYYRQQNSYLFWQYQMLFEWAEEEIEYLDREDFDAQIDQFDTAFEVGDVVEGEIQNCRIHEQFENCLKRFKPKNQLDARCAELATEAFGIYHDYPDTSIFRNAGIVRQQDEETITMDRYISFMAESEGWLCGTLEDSVQTEFNECMEQQEPTITRRFTETEIDRKDDMDFERRIFPMIDKLCFLLNEI